MDHVKLTESKLDVQQITELVAHESCGAVSLFVGTTRDNFEGKTVTKLEYESYDSMAKKEMLGICSQIRERWPDVKNIAIFHRLGVVPVKEASVVIAISSPHRRESLDAVSFTIEQLKKSVPIFKKEIYKDPEPPRKRLKIAPLNFEDCRVVDHAKIPQNLVQINVDESEVERRIQNFIERKREEIDRNNIRDFIAKKSDGCARVNSVIFRVKDSKGHLRVRRVKNEYGPQQNINYKNTLNNLMEKAEKPESSSSNLGLESTNERLENAEKFLNLEDTTKKSIFERLKAIENKILYLESISPEYSHFVGRTVPKVSHSIFHSQETKKPSYTAQSLDLIIKELENKRNI